MHLIAATAPTHFSRVSSRPVVWAVIIGTLFTLAIAPRVDAGGLRSGAGSIQSARASSSKSRSAADIEAERSAKQSRTAKSSSRISSTAKSARAATANFSGRR